MNKTYISVQGIDGRMGGEIKSLVSKNNEFELVKNFLKNKTQVVIDFSSPGGTAAVLKWAIKNKKPVVVGTTGFKKSEFHEINKAAKKIPILLAPNMSPGINILSKILKEIPQRFFKKIKIIETHHTKKKDRPSGTALKLKNILSKNTSLKNIPIKSYRKGDAIGIHEIIFENKSERLTIRHQALNRKVFAAGALVAAKWIKNKRPGLYTFEEVLGDKRWQ